MAEPTRITVRVSPDGRLTAETHGVTGPKCMDYIAILEDLLDAETVASEFTADYARQDREISNEVPNELRQY